MLSRLTLTARALFLIVRFEEYLNFISDVDEDLQKSLINGFALAAKFGVSASWAAIIAFTTEVYPTVVR